VLSSHGAGRLVNRSRSPARRSRRGALAGGVVAPLARGRADVRSTSHSSSALGPAPEHVPARGPSEAAYRVESTWAPAIESAVGLMANREMNIGCQPMITVVAKWRIQPREADEGTPRRGHDRSGDSSETSRPMTTIKWSPPIC